LSNTLAKNGLSTEVLVTLDPVGIKVGVTLISDIFWSYPEPKAKQWVNASVAPEDYDFSDLVADVGGQWKPEGASLSDLNVPASHWAAHKIFTYKLNGKISALEVVLQSLEEKYRKFFA